MLRVALLSAVLALTLGQDDDLGTGFDDVVAELKDQSQCSNKILASKGVRRSKKYDTRRDAFYLPGGKASVVFQEDKLWIQSKEGADQRVKIPGCFVLKAKDVRINRPLKTLTAEIDMRMGAIPNRRAKVRTWPKPLPCQQQNINNTCACGLSDSCFYCDFCKNFNKFLGGKDGAPAPKPANINRPGSKLSVFSRADRKWLDLDKCNCNVRPGLYDIEAEICTPQTSTLNKVLPEAVLALVQENQDKVERGEEAALSTEFTLYSIITLYDDNFRDVLGWKKPDGSIPKGKLYAHRSKHIVGCHFVVTDVIV